MKKILTTVLLTAMLALSTVAQCPSRETKEEFRKLPTFEQAKIWKSHFNEVLATKSLNQPQTELVYEWMRILNEPELFSTLDNGDTKTRMEKLGYKMDELQQRIAQNFSSNDRWDIFQSLTDKELQTYNLAFSVEENKMEKIITPNMAPQCDCQVGWSCRRDNENIFCDFSDRCTESSWGCGPLWIYSCTDECTHIA